MSFMAVNCFNPTGSCRKTFNLVKYPEIVLQVRNVGLNNYQGWLSVTSFINSFLKKNLTQ